MFAVSVSVCFVSRANILWPIFCGSYIGELYRSYIGAIYRRLDEIDCFAYTNNFLQPRREVVSENCVEIEILASSWFRADAVLCSALAITVSGASGKLRARIKRSELQKLEKLNVEHEIILAAKN